MRTDGCYGVMSLFKDQTVAVPPKLSTKGTEMDKLVANKFASDRMDDWNVHVEKDPHPLYRLFMKNSTP